jgi:hypothetical protein
MTDQERISLKASSHALAYCIQVMNTASIPGEWAKMHTGALQFLEELKNATESHLNESGAGNETAQA